MNKKWLKHLQSKDTNRITKQAIKYKPKLATICTGNGQKQTIKTSITT